MYIDKLDDIINKYNNIYHRILKMKPVGVESSIYINFDKEIIMKILSLKLLIMLEYLNIKIFLQKTVFQIDLKMCL